MSEHEMQSRGGTGKGAGFLNGCKRILKDYNIVLVLVVIIAICSIIAPRFLTLSNLMAIARDSSAVGIIALGMTFVIITGGIDLSSGHVLATAGVVLILLQGMQGMPLIVALVACVAAATIIGLLNGVIVAKAKLPPFIATLAIGTLVRSVSTWIAKGATITGRNVTSFTNIGNGSVGPIPIPLIIFIGLAVILHLVLNYTKFGSFVFAVGGNEKASRYSGISVDRVKLLVYMLAGLCVGIAAFINISRMAAVSATTTGNMFEFDAITAVIIGGTPLIGGKGRMLGTVIGVFILGIVSNMMVMMNISPYLSGAVKGIVILFAVLLQRQEKQQ